AVQEVVRQMRAELAPPIHHESTNPLVALTTPSPAIVSTSAPPSRPNTTAPLTRFSTNLIALATPSAGPTNRPKSTPSNLVASLTDSSTPSKARPVDTIRRTENSPHKDEITPGLPAKAAADLPATFSVAPQVVQLADEPPPKTADDRRAMASSPST